MCCRKRQRVTPFLITAATAAMSQTTPSAPAAHTSTCKFHGQRCNSDCEINYDIKTQAPRYMTVAAANNNGSRTSLTSQVFLDETKDVLSTSPPPAYSSVRSLIPERSASPVANNCSPPRRTSVAASSVYSSSSEFEKESCCSPASMRGADKFFYPKTLSYDHPTSVLDTTGPLSGVVERDVEVLGSEIATYGLTGRCGDKCRAKKAMKVLLKDLEVAMTARALVAGIDGSAYCGGVRRKNGKLSCQEKHHVKSVLKSVRREIMDEISNA